MEKEDLLNDAELKDVADLMQKKYAAFLNGKTFEVSNWAEGPGVLVQVLLRNSDDSYHYPVEGRVIPSKEEMTVRKGVLFLIDYIDLYFEEYLMEDDNLFLPIDWSKYEYEAVDFEMRGQILNLKVERMAESLLGNEQTLN